ncbi:hyaluronan synthase [Penicillium chermesinum]|uniref:Hyaluronan synthase n=1 Tax=Penicillium chermesinum TaxID=63820 RepID=A0A9W9NYT0_9EURO|nr:hyaluronan synthase [Penicillium chermesinum]KAJ5232217.1 hyaluronan synthase [Penicillium chermesinum]
MDSFSEKVYSGAPVFQQTGPEFLNFVGCLIVLPIYSIVTGYTRHPLTIDILLTIFAAEYNRYANDRRRRQLKSPPANLRL